MRITRKSELDIRPLDWTGLPRRFMNKGELEVIIALARSVTPRAVLEFGVNIGRTAKAILRNVPGIERYEGIDVPMGYVTAKEVQRNEIPEVAGQMVYGDPRFRLLLPARGSLDLRPGDLSAADVIFIDGDHGRDAVLHDTFLAHSVVRPGGIIIWHDYHDLGTVDVRAVLDELDARGGARLFHVEDTWLVYERCLGDRSSVTPHSNDRSSASTPH